MKDRLTTRMPEQLIERINMEAEKVQMSTSKLVRKLIEDGLNRGSVGGPKGLDLGPRLTQIEQKISALLSQNQAENNGGSKAVFELQKVFKVELGGAADNVVAEARALRDAVTDTYSHAHAANSASNFSAKESKRTRVLYGRLAWAAYIGLGLISVLVVTLRYQVYTKTSMPAATAPIVATLGGAHAISVPAWAELCREIGRAAQKDTKKAASGKKRKRKRAKGARR